MKSLKREKHEYFKARRKQRFKDTKKFLDKFYNCFSGVIYACAIVLLIFSVYIFAIGFHNLDLAYNMRGLKAEYGMDLIDHTSHDTYMTDYQAWTLGFEQIKTGFFCMFASGWFLSYYYFIWFSKDD